MDYKKVLRLHYVNKLSSREIAVSCGCSKTTVNEFLKRFREWPELMYPMPENTTNEFIERLLYKKPGLSGEQLLYRDFDKEAVYKALARKGETLKHLWQKYNAIGIVDDKKPMSYRQYCRRYSEWTDLKKLTFHIQRYPGVNLEVDYAGKQLKLHNQRNPEVDYCDLLDELIVLNRQEDLSRYRKRIRYYARIQLLFIDDFAISRYSEEGIKILYHLIKMRDDLGTSTLFSCQYAPDEWGKQNSDEEGCYGKLDGIRRRLTTGYTVLIERSQTS